MDIGIIGLGRLGGALARGLGRGWKEGRIFGYGRGREKAEAVAAAAPRLELLGSAREVFERCGIVFLWMKPADGMAVLGECAATVAAARPLVVSCATGTDYGRFCGRWAETLPNVNMCAGKGLTLVWHPESLGAEDRRDLGAVLASVGGVVDLPREEIVVYGALSSCGPALYATLMQEFADALAARHGYDRELCRALVRRTMAGTIDVLEEDGIDAEALVARVAHPGGSSEPGVGFLRERLPDFWAEMLARMRKW